MAHFEHEIIQGEGAGKWLPFARQKVAALHARARAQRVTALVQRWTVEGGAVEVAVRVVGNQRYIHIRRKQCPPFLSGFCDLVLHKEGDVIGPDVPFTPVYQVPDPNDPANTINIFRRFFPSPATKAENRTWRDEPALAVDQAAAKQLITLRATMFSGEMRKVVQVLQGMNVKIPYSPTYALTHGVFKASNSQRWVVEISSQGVVAWVMTMCRNPIRNAAGEEVLDYTPIATPKPELENIDAAKVAGTYVELAPASAVLDAYTKSAFFSNCGWAFNADGHEAANVCNAGEGFETHSYLYGITISETDGRPANASMALVTDGLVSGPNTAHMKYPLVSGELYSFDPFSGGAPTRPSDGPVYCYYNDGSSLEIFRYRYAAGSFSQGFSDPSPLLIAGSITCQSYLNRELKSGSESYTAIPYFEATAFDAKQITTARSLASFGTVQIGDAVSGIRVGFSSPYPFALQVQRSAQSVNRSAYNDSESVLSVLVIPHLNREAVYFCQRTVATVLPHNVVVQIGRGSYNNDAGSNLYELSPVTFCSLAPSQPIEDISSAEIGSPIFCADGSRSVSTNVTPGLTTIGYKWLGPGQIFRYRADEGLCVVQEPGEALYTDSATSFAVDGNQAILDIFLLSTPGVGRSFEPLNPDRWFSFLDVPGGQVAVVYQDAFDRRKYAASKDVVAGIVGSTLVSTLADYPVSEAGNVLNLIGVP